MNDFVFLLGRFLILLLPVLAGFVLTVVGAVYLSVTPEDDNKENKKTRDRVQASVSQPTSVASIAFVVIGPCLVVGGLGFIAYLVRAPKSPPSSPTQSVLVREEVYRTDLPVRMHP